MTGMIKKYEGLIAAPFTPMDKEGKLNTSLIPEYYSFLQKNGVSGAFINGTTGEGVSLTMKEKQVSAETWAQCVRAGGKMRIINLVGGTCYEECIENAIHSKEAGVSAIAVLAPFYFKPDEARLAEFVTIVGESVPELPVYFYHIPFFTGVNIPMTGFMKRVSAFMPNFAGIKYSHSDITDFMSCLRYENGKYDILWGREECLIAALAVGGKGSVGSTYNYAAPLYNTLVRAYNEGDSGKAGDLQLISIKIIELLEKYGGITTGKAFMKYIGIDCGKFRLPLRNLTDEMYREFVKDVKKLNIEHLFSQK